MLDRLIEGQAILLGRTERDTLAEAEGNLQGIRSTLLARSESLAEGSGTRRRLERVTGEVTEILGATVRELGEVSARGAVAAARGRVTDIRNIMEDVSLEHGVNVSLVNGLSATQIRQAVQRPFFGWTNTRWFQWHATEAAARIDRELRAAWFAGDSIAAISKRISDVTDISRREARVTARTAIQSAANQAASDLYKRNRKVLSGERWIATLDSATCPQCGALDGRILRFDSSFPRPPIHPQCRCFLEPVVRAGLLPFKQPRPPTWSQWITGKFGRFRPIEDDTAAQGKKKRAGLAKRQDAVLQSPTLGKLLRAGNITPSDLVTTRGRRRKVSEVVALSDRRKKAA